MSFPKFVQFKLQFFQYSFIRVFFYPASGAAPLNQQALHGQAMNQVQQQQSMGHIQGNGKHIKNIEEN